jgi:hypothetical protein
LQAVCVLLPLPLLWGFPALAYLGVIGIGHAVIEWAMARVRKRPAMHGPRLVYEESTLDHSWSPMPALTVLTEQGLQLLLVLVAWAGLLATSTPTGPLSKNFAHGIGQLTLEQSQQGMAAIALGLSLTILNGPAAYQFISTLVRAPRKAATSEQHGSPSPARVGATIGVLERLLICTLTLVGQPMAVGLVITAKTIARFKQLEDREFGEYYLLGTLASVSIALTSAMIAVWVWTALASTG